jgi:hypothetical protein
MRFLLLYLVLDPPPRAHTHVSGIGSRGLLERCDIVRDVRPFFTALR